MKTKQTFIPMGPLTELAPTVPVQFRQLKTPIYGHCLEAYAPGQIYYHPRGMTISAAFAQEFATTFMDANPLYLNDPYARAHGFEGMLVPPLMVLNLALSLGVQNDSEQAIANLGYYDVRFPRAVYPGDTIQAVTRIVDVQDRQDGKPGIVHLRTLGLNQRQEIVVHYDRKILVGPRGEQVAKDPAQPWPYPDLDALCLELPPVPPTFPTDLTGRGTYFEDFAPGMVIAHANGRTITDEHLPWTYRLGNTHPLHYDRLYSTRRQGAMSGEPIVYGGLVFAWIAGLASRDTTENALLEVGYTEGYHSQPSYTGDTLYAVSRVLATQELPDVAHAGLVSFQLIGVKGMTAREAIDAFAADLFKKEVDKKRLGKEKIPAKIFEIERQVLIKKRPR